MNKDKLEDYLLGFLSLTIVTRIVFGFLMFKMFEFSINPYPDAWNLLLSVFLFLTGECILTFYFYIELKALYVLYAKS